MKTRFSMLFLCFCAYTICTAQNNNIEALIDFSKEKEGHVTIVGKAKGIATPSNEFSFIMMLVKKENGNNTNSKQSGKFVINQNEVKSLSSIQVNLSELSQFEVNLKILSGEQVIAERTIISDEAFFENYKNLAVRPSQIAKKEFIPKQNQKIYPSKNQFEQEDAIEIGGLIIDDTRSKIGRDFYDLFYSKWTDPSDSNSFSITVKELPARGRASRIAIEVDGNVVVQRMVQPRLELMELLAEQSVNIVTNYLSKKKELNKELESEDQQGSGIF